MEKIVKKVDYRAITKENNELLLRGDFKIDYQNIHSTSPDYMESVRFILSNFKNIQLVLCKNDEYIDKSIEVYGKIKLNDLNNLQNISNICNDATLKIYYKYDKLTLDINKKIILKYKKTKVLGTLEFDKDNNCYHFSDEKDNIDNNHITLLRDFLRTFYIEKKTSEEQIIASSAKLGGNFGTLLIKKYLEDMLKDKEFCISKENVYITGCNTEWDLLILKKSNDNKSKDNMFNIYDPDDVAAAVEVKSSGLFGKVENKEQGVRNNLIQEFTSIKDLNRKGANLKFLFISLIEGNDWIETERNILGNLYSETIFNKKIEFKSLDENKGTNEQFIINSTSLIMSATTDKETKDSDLTLERYDIRNELANFLNDI